MSANPYRFTVEVRRITSVIHGEKFALELLDGERMMYAWLGLSTEAEANEHAELIRQAMREVS
jgi:hypothetical protein